MLRQYAAWVILNLAERDSLKSACSLQAEAKTADTAKQVEDAELSHTH